MSFRRDHLRGGRTAEIQKVAMKDDTAKGRLIIEKTKGYRSALKGANLN